MIVNVALTMLMLDVITVAFALVVMMAFVIWAARHVCRLTTDARTFVITTSMLRAAALCGSMAVIVVYVRPRGSAV